MGAPLAYVSDDDHHADPTRLIGMLTGGGRALILSSVFQLCYKVGIIIVQIYEGEI